MEVLFLFLFLFVFRYYFVIYSFIYLFAKSVVDLMCKAGSEGGCESVVGLMCMNTGECAADTKSVVDVVCSNSAADAHMLWEGV